MVYFLICIVCIVFTHPVVSFPTDGIIIIDYPSHRSTKYMQFIQEIYDSYTKKYHRTPPPIFDVGVATLCLLIMLTLLTR